MADLRMSKSLHLLVSLISSSALIPATNGLVIPSWWQPGDDENVPAKKTSSTPKFDPLRVNVQKPPQSLDSSPSRWSHVKSTPEWAKETPPDLSYGSASEDLGRNLYDGNGQFLPTPLPKSSRRRPHPYFKSPKKLPTPGLQWDGDFDLPTSRQPKRRPANKPAIKSSVTRQPNPLAALESKVLEEDLVKSTSASAPSPPYFTDATVSASGQNWLHIEDVETHSIKSDSFSPPARSLPPCGGALHFLSNPQWFERTTVLILGMLMLFFLAVGVVEVADSIWRRLVKSKRRRWPSRRGALWLGGGEKRLCAIEEVDDEE